MYQTKPYEETLKVWRDSTDSSNQNLQTKFNVENDLSSLFSAVGKFYVKFDSDGFGTSTGFALGYTFDCPAIAISNIMRVTKGSLSSRYGAKFSLGCVSSYAWENEEFDGKAEVEMECLFGGKWNTRSIPKCQSK